MAQHVVEAAKASGAAEWLPLLVEKDLTDPPTLLQYPSVVLETGMPPEVWRVFQDSLRQQDGATPQNAITDTDSRAVSHCTTSRPGCVSDSHSRTTEGESGQPAGRLRHLRRGHDQHPVMDA